MDRSSRRYVTIEEVYRRYGHDLLRFLHGAHPHLNLQDCEDLLHQAILKAVARIEQFDPARGSLRLWLLGILRNEVRQDLRARRQRRTEAAGELEDELDPTTAIGTTAALRDELRAVEEALRAVPFAEREALLAPLRTEGSPPPRRSPGAWGSRRARSPSTGSGRASASASRSRAGPIPGR